MHNSWMAMPSRFCTTIIWSRFAWECFRLSQSQFKIKVEPDTFHDETPLKHTVVGAKDANWVELCVKYREMIDNKSTPKAESGSPIVEQSDLQENSRSNIPEGNSQIVGKKRSHPGSDQNFPRETT